MSSAISTPTQIQVYKSLKGNVFILKSQACVIFEDEIFAEYDHLKHCPNIVQTLGTLEQCVQGVLEWVNTSELDAAIQDFKEKAGRQWKQLVDQSIGSFNLENVLKQLGMTSVANATQEEIKKVMDVMKPNYSAWQATALKTIQEVIALHPKVFLPGYHSAKVVRMFYDDNQTRFVMKEELEHALNGTPYTQEAMKAWQSIDFKAALSMALRMAGNDVEFLKVNVQDLTAMSLNPNDSYCCGQDAADIKKEDVPKASVDASQSVEEPAALVASADSDKQVANDANKKRNKKRKEKANKSKAAKVTDAPEVIVEEPQVQETPEPIVQVPKKQKESSTCQKCFRTSNRCKEAKAELKDSQNYAKRLEKELAEMKKKMEVMEENHVQQMEAQQKEQEALKVLVVSLERENKQLKQNTVQKSVAPMAVVAPIQKERSLEIKQKLIEFQDKLGEFRAFDPIGKAAQEIRKLTTLTRIQTVREHCEYELLVFKENSKKYEDALEKNIELIQSNTSTTISDLIPVPEYPVLPEVFYMELKKAQDQDRKNKELENECIICTEPMDKQTEDELFQCPECNKKVHLQCISQWFERSNSCPCCRTQWT